MAMAYGTVNKDLLEAFDHVRWEILEVWDKTNKALLHTYGLVGGSNRMFTLEW